MSAIDLNIYDFNSVILREKVISFSAYALDGSFEILKDHIPYINRIVSGTARIIKENGDIVEFKVNPGFIKVQDNKINLLLEN